jgi:hypothetical protein
MSTLAEIDAAVEQLSIEDKRELYLKILAKLEAMHSLPEPRQFSMEEMQRWFDEDEREGIEIREELGLRS